ncbi:MAG: polysaccharide export protein [Chlorogloeopsis fritschii C42_A2020_084]|uniref:polysaccharide biosynthesis/export family protein n=1 Tax=Chlorogloeopsis fritschii TaxID=1124 RepID=UPI001A02ED9B|nr:polysaccharide biosynthesis/export family protein [Chlorogloeopsis fritschii]MBF2007056.1 polysaccharide export protein [Chlorogloeopsis fritschii C42_A2020_084]
MLNTYLLKIISQPIVGMALLTAFSIACPSNSFAQQAQPILAPSTQVDKNYILGEGDRIRVNIFEVPKYTSEYIIPSSGAINLPLIGNVLVQGLTPKQAADKISQKYSRFLKRPMISVNLLAPPINITVAGEVTSPGVYTLNSLTDAGNHRELTLSKVIQLAGGIKPEANIRNIVVRRPTRSGTEQTINIDLWKLLWNLLRNGDTNQEIIVEDGDRIVIPTATALNSAEVTQLATTLSPPRVSVGVIGEVKKPGQVELLHNSSLNQAILAAGGFNDVRARSSTVDLIRLNSNGSVTKRTIKMDLAAGINEQTNPILRNNDVVVVYRRPTRTPDSIGALCNSTSKVLGMLRSVFTRF